MNERIKAYELEPEYMDTRDLLSELLYEQGDDYSPVIIETPRGWHDYNIDDLDDVKAGPHDTVEYHGYSQGDVCWITYNTDKHTRPFIDELAMLYLNTCVEFSIDDVYGYYIPDTVVWGDPVVLRETLANYYGCDAGDLDVYLIDGHVTTPKYKQV